MPRSLRFPGESDKEFTARAVKAAEIARELVDAALANHCIRDFIADANLPMWTEESQRRSPVIRLDYEQAIAIGSIGETLHATRNKHWGAGPQVMPLEPDDLLYERRIAYLFRDSCHYNRRFEQRKKLKELLGKKHRKLVGLAKQSNQRDFLKQITAEQPFVLRKGLQIGPVEFWAAVKGRAFFELPEKMNHVSDVLLCQLPKKKKQIMLPIDGPPNS